MGDRSVKRITINDIARLAGVSKTTVSHVINNTRFVEDVTRQRVQQAIEEYGYQPSLVARSLTTQRTETIGVIVSDMTNDFFGEMLRGIEDVLQPHNYSILVCNTDEILEREDHYINLLLRQRVDGIIAAETSKRWEALSRADTLHTPLVLVDRRYNGFDYPYVGVKNFEGAYLGARYLIEHGYRQIGILAGFQRLSTMRDRLTGFQHAMLDAGIPLPEEWVIESELNIPAACAAAQKILTLPNPPKALFMSNNLLSVGTLMAVRDLGLVTPGDVALIGFDDHPWAEVANPPLTVVRQPARLLGQKAAETLLRLIRDEAVEEPEILLDCELVVRNSC